MFNLRSLARLWALALLLPLAWGCFKYKEVITIEQDGKGTVQITASIPEDMAKGYRDTNKFTGQVPPPINAGMIENLFLGNKGVKVLTRDITPEPVEGQWEYNILVEFTSVDALKQTPYFKDRGLSLTFIGGRQMKFSERLAPTLIAMAMTQEKSLPKDPYSGGFLEASKAKDFDTVVGDAQLSYAVTMPGINATADPTMQCIVAGNPDNTTTATWSYSQKDLSAMTAPPALSVMIDLPTERGFMPVIIALLLASIVGILAPAIRLLMLKSHHSA